MSEKQIKKRAEILFNRVKRDLDISISPKKCNTYIDDLEALKEDIYDSGFDWVEDLDDISGVEEEGFMSDGADKEEIGQAIGDVYDQLDRILGNLGVDTTEQKKSSMPSSININFSPHMIQNANASANADIKQQVDKLVKEYKEESQKILPDNDKLDNIIENLKTLGSYGLSWAKKLGGMFGSLFNL